MTTDEGLASRLPANVDLRAEGAETVSLDSRQSCLICLCTCSILFLSTCLLHSEPVFSSAFADVTGLSKREAEWPLYVSSIVGSIAAPAGGFISRFHPNGLLMTATCAASSALIACFAWCDFLSWTFFVGFVFGTATGATKTACIFIVNVCFKRYRCIANGLNLTGEAIASYVGAPFLHSLAVEFGIKGSLLLMGAITLNAALAAFIISRFTLDIPEGPEEVVAALKAKPTKAKSKIEIESDVFMEETGSLMEEDKELLRGPVNNWSASTIETAEGKDRRMNIVQCVAVIEHWSADSESDSECPTTSMGDSEGEGSEDDGQPQERKDDGNWSESKENVDKGPPVQRRGSWYHEDKAAKRRSVLLPKWVSSSVESLRTLRRASGEGYKKLVDAEDSENNRKYGTNTDTCKRDTQGSGEDVYTKSARSVSFSAGSSTVRWGRSSATREKLNRAMSHEGCVLQHTEALNVLEDLPLEVAQSEQQRPLESHAAPDGGDSGVSLPETNRGESFDNGNLADEDLLAGFQDLALPERVPVTRRYSRLAQDILIRQLQDKQRRRFRRHFRFFSNPILYVICVANSVMFNSTVVFVTGLADVLRAKQLPTSSLTVQMLPTFHIGDIAACLCSGWLTDEGHLKVRRAIAVDFLILGSSMLIVSLHTSINTYIIQSLLQGWVFGQSTTLLAVLLVKSLGVTYCGVAYGVVMFATGVSTFFREALVVHFRDSFGTHDFIFNFHGILALAVAGMFVVEIQFNRALERKRRMMTQEL